MFPLTRDSIKQLIRDELAQVENELFKQLIKQNERAFAKVADRYVNMVINNRTLINRLLTYINNRQV